MPELPAGAHALAGQLDRSLEQAGLALSRHVRSDLLAWLTLLTRWSRVHNLTAVRDAAAMIDRHLVDSLRLQPLLRDLGVGGDGSRADADAIDLLDIGSGAGLPGIPLAIAERGWRIVSVESNGKKVRFQRQSKLSLGLDAFEVRGERIEAVRLRARAVVARAFAAPATVLALAAERVKPDGIAVLLPGGGTAVPDPLPPGWRMESVADRSVHASSPVVVCRRARTVTDGGMDYTSGT